MPIRLLNSTSHDALYRMCHSTPRRHRSSVPHPRSTSRSPPPYSESVSFPRDMPYLPTSLPPTPTPSVESPIVHSLEKMFDSAEAGPSTYKQALARDLPPTPPNEEGAFSPVGLNFSEPVLPQRVRRGRRPASVYPASTEPSPYQPQRKYTDPTPRTQVFMEEMSHQQLDVDLDAYSTTDYDDSRDPTLSFVTTSTADSISTPHQCGYKDDVKDVGEPRIRTTAGRTNAYSSAESSMASGAYSYHAYADNNIYHPHPPPLPSIPNVFAGLGITAPDPPISPTNSFAHRPWKRDVVNRLRSDSASSMASVSTSDTAPSVDNSYLYQYERLPWEQEQSRPEAVALVDEGREKILDKARLEGMGGMEGLQSAMDTLAGTTHLLLPDCDVPSLPALLTVLAPSLVVLDISSSGIAHLPEELRHCTLLEELNISDNPLRVLPGWMGELVGLRMLVVDGCGLQNLPQELAQLTSLHTLCARRNRMVALPAWLCLLYQLETLRVDDNAFAEKWQSIVAPILAETLERPQIPSRTSSQRVHALRSPPSITSLTSSSSVRSREIITSMSSISVNEGWMSPSSSAAQSMYQIGLGPIAEDHPHSALPQAETPIPATPSDIALNDLPRDLRKMRSAGTLLDQRPDTVVAPIMSAFGVRSMSQQQNESSSTLIPPSSSRFASLSAAEGRRAATAMSLHEEVDVVSPLQSHRLNAPAMSTSKSGGRWGFLRKMSMNKLRPDKSTMTASASANLKTMPLLRHTDSDPISTLQPPRPVISTAKSAMTLPTRQMFDAGEFGQMSASSSSTLPLNLPNTRGMFTTAGTRGKRRSFLPVDTPPSINVSIPSVSPFLPSAPSFDEPTLPPARSEDTIEDTTMIASELVESPSVELDTRYTAGLESIKSYLRDLYDLSRPRRDPFGGFEVVGNGAESQYAASASSDPHSPPGARSSVGTRSRRPTLTTQSSSPSVISDKGSVEVKKMKNDPSKRVKVIREIYETERTYVRSLGELVSIYVRPADQKVTGRDETVIPRAESKIVFGGIEPILSIHREHLLPSLEKAVRPLLEGGDDEEGELSARTAQTIGEVFRTYIVYMKQYSTYTNNFDNALARFQTWTATSSTPNTPALPTKPKTPTGPPAGFGSISSPVPVDLAPHSGGQLTAGQKKRVKTFLKKCREHPMHSQINLESYLLLPVQRVTRYRLLLENLAGCTQPGLSGASNALDDALNGINTLAQVMNEEKRDERSRLRLIHWQQRIQFRGQSSLVQPFRRLECDGELNLIRLVKKSSSFVEVDNTDLSNQDGDHTIMPSKIVVPVEYLAPEPMERPVMLILCSDMIVLVQQRDNGGWEGAVDLFNVLRPSTMMEPASIVHGNVLRVVDNKSIYYFNGGPHASSTVQWCSAINDVNRK